MKGTHRVHYVVCSYVVWPDEVLCTFSDIISLQAEQCVLHVHLLSRNLLVFEHVSTISCCCWWFTCLNSQMYWQIKWIVARIQALRVWGWCAYLIYKTVLVSRFAFTENVVGMAQKPLFSQSCSSEGYKWLLSRQCSLWEKHITDSRKECQDIFTFFPAF